MFGIKKLKEKVNQLEDKISIIEKEYSREYRVGNLEREVVSLNDELFKINNPNGRIEFMKKNTFYYGFDISGEPQYDYTIRYRYKYIERLELFEANVPPVAFALNDQTLLIKLKDDSIKRFELDLSKKKFVEVKTIQDVNVKVFKFQDVGFGF